LTDKTAIKADFRKLITILDGLPNATLPLLVVWNMGLKQFSA
jgi:hypothetical protein